MSIERKSSDRRKLRAGMVFVLVVAGTALIGWGGLAAWQAVTQNNGSTASTLGVHMSNAATVAGNLTPITCTDVSSPSACGAIFDVGNITPGYSSATPVGTVQITNTGTEASTFQLSLKSATVSGDDGLYQPSTDTTLCSDLILTVKDSEATPHQIYQGSVAAMTNVNLSTQGGSPTWDPGESDTFTFNLSLPNSTPTDEDFDLHGGLHLGPERRLTRLCPAFDRPVMGRRTTRRPLLALTVATAGIGHHRAGGRLMSGRARVPQPIRCAALHEASPRRADNWTVGSNRRRRHPGPAGEFASGQREGDAPRGAARPGQGRRRGSRVRHRQP